LFPPTAALKLIQRSGHGFNALCTAATEGFRKFDVDHSDWMELDKLPSLLQQLQHVPMAPPLMDQSVHGKGEEGEEGDEGGEGARRRDWLEYAALQLDRNGDGAIALDDFLTWWVSQCPTCVPLRGVSHGAGGWWLGWLVGCPLDDLTIVLFFWCRFLFFILIMLIMLNSVTPNETLTSVGWLWTKRPVIGWRGKPSCIV